MTDATRQPGPEAQGLLMEKVYTIAPPDRVAVWQASSNLAAEGLDVLAEVRVVEGDELDEMLATCEPLLEEYSDDELGCSFSPISGHDIEQLRSGEAVLVATTAQGSETDLTTYFEQQRHFDRLGSVAMLMIRGGAKEYLARHPEVSTPGDLLQILELDIAFRGSKSLAHELLWEQPPTSYCSADITNSSST